jgi:hypothetical protein
VRGVRSGGDGGPPHDRTWSRNVVSRNGRVAGWRAPYPAFWGTPGEAIPSESGVPRQRARPAKGRYSRNWRSLTEIRRKRNARKVGRAGQAQLAFVYRDRAEKERRFANGSLGRRPPALDCRLRALPARPAPARYRSDPALGDTRWPCERASFRDTSRGPARPQGRHPSVSFSAAPNADPGAVLFVLASVVLPRHDLVGTGASAKE